MVFRWRNTEGWPVEFVSPNVTALTGYPVEQFSSGELPYASLIHSEDITLVTQEVMDASGSDVEWFEHAPYRIHHADGRTLWVYDYTVVLRGPDGAPTHFYGYIMDITDRIERERLIEQQAQMIANLGTPILQVWSGVLAIPLIGQLDNERAATVMDSLLRRVSEDGAKAAIVDLTGVEELDAATAKHLSTMVRALALLGCECVISGLAPSVAQTVVLLEVDFGNTRMYRSLQAALTGILGHAPDS